MQSLSFLPQSAPIAFFLVRTVLPDQCVPKRRELALPCSQERRGLWKAGMLLEHPELSCQANLEDRSIANLPIGSTIAEWFQPPVFHGPAFS
jgi:hypothetical protein